MNVIESASDGKNRIFNRVDDRASEIRQKRGSKFLSVKSCKIFAESFLRKMDKFDSFLRRRELIGAFFGDRSINPIPIKIT
jgi:hypothetical protein